MLSKDQKKKFVQQMSKQIKSGKSVGVIKTDGIPDKLLQSSRNKLKEGTIIIMGRKNLIIRILESDERTKPLLNELTGTSALIISDNDPFQLYAVFRDNVLRMAAKPKQIAPDDIEVKSGETNIQPGQGLTDLKNAGIDVKIDKGKVAISKDKVIVKKGEVISPQVAKALRLLEMTPFSISLLPSSLLSEGMLFQRDVLEITQGRSLSEIQIAFRSAFAIALNAGIENSYTIKPLMINAFRGAMHLGVKAKIYEPGIIEKLLANAVVEASALSKISDKTE
jgi:large subunit ribosomal protein L10